MSGSIIVQQYKNKKTCPLVNKLKDVKIAYLRNIYVVFSDALLLENEINLYSSKFVEIANSVQLVLLVL